MIGIAINAVEMATDGIGFKLAADAWAGASPSEKPAAFYGAYAVGRIGGGLARAQVIVLFGGAVGLFGLAIALGSGYPRWLGVLGAVIGAISLIVGIGVTLSPAFATVPLALPVVAGVLWIALTSGLLWKRTGAR